MTHRTARTSAPSRHATSILLAWIALFVGTPTVAASVGGWQEIAQPVTPSGLPEKRLEHSAIYDPVGKRMIVFGGLYGGLFLNDTQQIGLDPLDGWLAIGTGQAPAPRWGHSAIYDPVRHRMIVYGGIGNEVHGDLRALDLAGNTWSVMTAAGTPPSARFTHAAIYDPVRDRMIVFGGYDSDRRNDVWALSLGGGTPTWQLLAVAGSPPSPRNGLAAAYDPVRDRLLLFGGNDDNARNDLWALNLAGAPTWTQIVLGGTPPEGRRQPRMIYDAPRDQLVLFGGVDIFGTDGFNEVWTLSLSGALAWTRHAATSSSPSRRWGHSMIFDTVHDRAVVFGGVDLVDWRNDLYALSLDETTPAWTSLQPTTIGEPVTAAWGGSMILDPVRRRAIKFGGLGSEPIGELMALDLTATNGWKTLAAQGTPPSARFTHTAVYDELRDRMLVFGGHDSDRRNDVWALSLADPPTWSLVATIGSPPSPRNGHTAIYDPVRDRMLIFGGNDDLALNDVWELRLAGTPTWAPIYPDRDAPVGRQRPAAFYDPIEDRMLVFGGVALDGSTGFDELWELSLGDRPRWTLLDVGTVRPSRRWGHSLVYDPTRDIAVLFGGVDLVDWRNDVWLLRVRQPAWSPTEPAPPLPGKRLNHAAVLDDAGRRMIIHGGLVGGSRYADTWALSLDPEPLEVTIDIEPGDPSNRIREGSGEVQCAVMSSAIFDARLVDPATARLASAPARTNVQETDVNGDSRLDVVLRFAARDLVLRPLMLEATLEAQTIDGQPLTGHDAITIVARGTRPHGAPIFALRGAEPNPARGPIAIHFSLADDSPARLELIDARGRRIWHEEVGARGPGEHEIVWAGPSAPAAGTYWLRLRNREQTATNKLVVLP